MDRLATRVEPLTRSESYQYDLAGNMMQFMDRKSYATKAREAENYVAARRARAIHAESLIWISAPRRPAKSVNF